MGAALTLFDKCFAPPDRTAPAKSSRFSQQQQQVGGLSGLTTEGAVLAGARPEAFAAAHTAVARAEETSAPLYAGTFADFVRERGTGDEALASQLRNVVRKCAHCGKANGFTMSECNGCNTPFPADQPRTHTENVFMGFVYGVARTDSFPLSISVRMQTPELLVFDDPLALSACHLNVIPTASWVPDWRILLRNPAEGLRLVQQLEDAAWSCVSTQYLSDETWCVRCHAVLGRQTRARGRAARGRRLGGRASEARPADLRSRRSLPQGHPTLARDPTLARYPPPPKLAPRACMQRGRPSMAISGPQRVALARRDCALAARSARRREGRALRRAGRSARARGVRSAVLLGC